MNLLLWMLLLLCASTLLSVEGKRICDCIGEPSSWVDCRHKDLTEVPPLTRFDKAALTRKKVTLDLRDNPHLTDVNKINIDSFFNPVFLDKTQVRTTSSTESSTSVS